MVREVAKKLRDVEPAKAESGWMSHGHKVSDTKWKILLQNAVFSLGKSSTIEFLEQPWETKRFKSWFLKSRIKNPWHK